MTSRRKLAGSWVAIPDVLVEREPGTFTVRETEHYLVEVMVQIFNFRVVLSWKPDMDVTGAWEAGWCYFGTTAQSWVRAVLGAAMFDPEIEWAPEGFDKAIGHRLHPPRLVQDPMHKPMCDRNGSE